MAVGAIMVAHGTISDAQRVAAVAPLDLYHMASINQHGVFRDACALGVCQLSVHLAMKPQSTLPTSSVAAAINKSAPGAVARDLKGSAVT